MIYSIISNDIIFKNLENEKSIQYEEINYKGSLLQVCYNENKSYIIERLISTDPNDYLNNELQPGNIINMSNKIDF
ncbi:MAG TPA: YlzJ-like family protein [Defluviitaleaceae bacterium]|nr:hypothetical protein [Candidatus Epulonipiscium sp.]HOA81314.1 YlzJ-like family protein [Defluviitaleaceae bacterium]